LQPKKNEIKKKNQITFGFCLESNSSKTQTHFTRLSQRLKSMLFKRFYFSTLNLPMSKKAWSFKIRLLFPSFQLNVQGSIL